MLALAWVVGRIPSPSGFVVDGDWGLQMAGATQVAFGEHPFVDYPSTYGPLTFYASALAQWATAQRPIGEIALVVAGYVFAYCLLYALFLRTTGSRALSAGVLAVALLLMPRAYKYYVVLGPAATLLAAFRYLDRPDTPRLWALSAAIVATGLYRPDFGVYAAFAGGVAALLCPGTARERLMRLGRLTAAILACALPWLVWLVSQGSLLGYLDDSSFGAARHASGMTLPWPWPDLRGPLFTPANGVAFSFIAFCSLPLLASAVLLDQAEDAPSRALRRHMIVAVCLAQTTLLQAVHRPRFNHLLQGIVISLVLGALLSRVVLDGLRSARGGGRAKPALAGLALLASTLAIAATAVTRGQLPRVGLAQLSADLRLFAASREELIETLARRQPGEPIFAALRYVRDRTEPGQRILVLPEPLTNFYYFCECRFAGGHPMVAPGYFSTEAEQERSVARLLLDPPRFVIDIQGFALDSMEERRTERFAPILWSYLAQRFTSERRFGLLVVRSAGAGPPG